MEALKLDVLIKNFNDPKVIEALIAIGTQMVAFIIFAWILKKYAWKPFIRVLDERQEKIKSQFENIDDLEKKHLAMKEQYSEKLKNVEHVIDLRIQEGVNEGKRHAQDIVRRSRKDAADIIQKSKAHLSIEVKRAQNDLKERMIEIIINSVEQLIKTKMDDEKHRELISSIIEEVECKKC